MKLRTREVNFMGHLLTNKGLMPDPAKEKAITKMAKPADMEGVQCLDRFVNYLTKLLPTLCHLIQKDIPWDWSSEHDQAFANVQRLVTEAPVLCYYDPTDKLSLQTS